MKPVSIIFWLKQSYFILLFCSIQSVIAQTNPQYQDEKLNNLVHATDYKTCKLGELGAIQKFGSGKRTMILIPGIGFGASAFKEFIAHYEKEFSIYAVTPAGFGNTSAPPMPDTSTKYSELTWTNGIVTGILNLIEKEKLNKPILVAHFVTATQVALNLSLYHSEKIGKVVIISGSPYRWYPQFTKDNSMDWKNEIKLNSSQRSSYAEMMATLWFRTVTKETFDNFNWTSDDYCKDTITGKVLWNEVANVPLPILIRYMSEWGAYDINDQYSKIKNPLLLLIPDFNKVNDNKQYLKYYNGEIVWKHVQEANNPNIKVQVIPNSQIFMWLDNPQNIFLSITQFLNSK